MENNPPGVLTQLLCVLRPRPIALISGKPGCHLLFFNSDFRKLRARDLGAGSIPFDLFALRTSSRSAGLQDVLL